MAVGISSAPDTSTISVSALIFLRTLRAPRIRFYGISLYVYGMYNILNTLNNINFILFIILLTLVTFSIGYWWFIKNEGEARIRRVYDE